MNALASSDVEFHPGQAFADLDEMILSPMISRVGINLAWLHVIEIPGRHHSGRVIADCKLGLRPMRLVDSDAPG